MISKLTNLIICLNAQPVIYRGKNFYLVGFGLFAALATFFGLTAFSTFITLNGIKLHYSEETWTVIIIFSTVIFSKLLHPLVLGNEYFKNPIYYLRQTAFYNQGGQIGVLISIVMMALVEHINVLLLLDAASYSYCLALVIGRLGCYNYGCCYGKVTTSSFSIKYQHPESKILRLHPELASVPLIPTQLYESAYCLLLLITLSLLFHYHIEEGIAACFFMIAYNGFRIYIHRYRSNDVDKQGNQQDDKNIFLWIASLFALLGVCLFIFLLAHSLPEFNTEPFTSYIYFSINFTNVKHLISMILISTVIFIVYGYHHIEIGRHF